MLGILEKMSHILINCVLSYVDFHTIFTIRLMHVYKSRAILLIPVTLS